jgi:hypothetical protein
MVVVRRLVATLLLATWHLEFERGEVRGRRGQFGCHVRRVIVAVFVRRVVVAVFAVVVTVIVVVVADASCTVVMFVVVVPCGGRGGVIVSELGTEEGGRGSP